MPDFWQFPTVSMGLGPITAIYQARFMKYLEDRGITPTAGRKVWAFLGDGETDEPESLGAISLAGREKLDNLIFVVNCNLQRLDGPVRGNGKIIQELEASFRGAGWNVIKVIWGSYWDPLLSKDKDGVLRQRMEEAVDGEYQAYKGMGGAYTREHFFGKSPELREMVANMSDDDIWRLNRGGHDPAKIYAAYDQAVHQEGQPTVILAKTVKGYGTGEGTEGRTSPIKCMTFKSPHSNPSGIVSISRFRTKGSKRPHSTFLTRTARKSSIYASVVRSWEAISRFAGPKPSRWRYPIFPSSRGISRGRASERSPPPWRWSG